MFGLGHVAKQSQTQTVTAAVVFEARLLQAAGAELDAIIEAALDENPFLSLRDGLESAPSADMPSESGAQDGPSALDWLDAGEDDIDPDRGVIERTTLDVEDDGRGVERLADDGDGGIHAHLESQLALARLRPEEAFVARRLIAELDDAGYLLTDLETVRRALGVSAAVMEDVFYVLRGFEPSGAFARSLKECLSFQAADRGLLDDAMKAVLFRLEMVGDGRLADIAARSGQPRARIEACVQTLKSFDPKPGLRFGVRNEPPGPPEILIEKVEPGGWRARLNPDAFPKLDLEAHAHATILAAVRKAEERRFVQDRWRDARFLKEALARRAATLQRIADFIVERQSGFFDRGAAALTPLLQSEAAEALDLDPSTVSRALSGKRLRSPRGLFDLTTFFPAPVSTTVDQSADAVKSRIRALIEDEPPESPISDEAITETLKSDGLGVARRTVAKYRESMGLAPARRRRRMKAGMR